METLERERLKDRDVLPLLVILSDGRANVALSGAQVGYGAAASGEIANLAGMVADARIPAVVVDTEQDFIKLELAKPMAEAMSAQYIKLDDLAADSLAAAIRGQLPDQTSSEPVVT